MTNQERLMASLFGNSAREHVDIKFFIAADMDLTADRLCGEAVSMLDQMDAGQADVDFIETFEQRDASEFIGGL